MSKSKISAERILRRLLFYKYGFFILLLLFSASIFLFNPNIENGSIIQQIRDILLLGGIISLVISFFNDFFVKGEARIRDKIERQTFANEFAENFFQSYADINISETILQRLILRPERRDLILQTLSKLVVNDPELQKYVQGNYLAAIKKPPRFRNVSSVSKLHNFDPTTGDYTWTCTQTFSSLDKNLDFRVFVCSDSSLSSRLESGGRILDFTILLSEYDKDKTYKWLQEDVSMRGIIKDEKSMRKKKIDISKNIDLELFKRKSGLKDLNIDDGQYCLFHHKSSGVDAEYEFTFQHKLNLYKDPFFCWTFQDFSFVDKVEVDYHELLPFIGRVSPVLFFQSSLCDMHHKRDEGRINVNINDLVSPGEGFVLVFRKIKGIKNGI